MSTDLAAELADGSYWLTLLEYIQESADRGIVLSRSKELIDNLPVSQLAADRYRVALDKQLRHGKEERVSGKDPAPTVSQHSQLPSVAAPFDENAESADPDLMDSLILTYFKGRGLKLSAMTLMEETGTVTASKEDLGRIIARGMAPPAQTPTTPIPEQEMTFAAPMPLTTHGNDNLRETARAIELLADVEARSEKKIAELSSQLEQWKQRALTAEKASSPTSTAVSLIPREGEGEERSQNNAAAFQTNDSHSREPALVGGNGAGAANHASLIPLLASALPPIVNSVLIAKRGALIPLLAATIQHHPEQDVREAMLQLLFHLIKKPSESQRAEIVGGFIQLAQSVGPIRTQEELLPVVWDEINHGHYERRILVAEVCGALSPFLSSTIRESLLLSILSQLMCDDSHAAVRLAATKSLAHTIQSFLDFGKDQEVVQRLLQVLLDEDSAVVTAGLQELLPAVCTWLSRVEGKLTSVLLQTTFDGIRHCWSTSTASAHRKCGMWIKGWEAMQPHLLQVLMTTAPFKDGDNLYDHYRQAGNLRERSEALGAWSAALGAYLNLEATSGTEDHTWDAMDWCACHWLPTVLDCLAISGDASPPLRIRRALMASVLSFSRLLGVGFADTVCKNIIRDVMDSFSTDALGAQSYANLLPLFLEIVGFVSESEFMSCLSSLLIEGGAVGSEEATIVTDAIIEAVPLLIVTDLRESMLKLWWESLVHPSTNVRLVIAKCFGAAVTVLPPDLLTTRFFPAVVTLCSDPDVKVRQAATTALGPMLQQLQESDVSLMEKLTMQLENNCDESHLSTGVSTMTMLALYLPHCNRVFREDFLLPLLVRVADKNASRENSNSELTSAMFRVFQAARSVTLSEACTRSRLIPGLQLLALTAQQLSREEAADLEEILGEYREEEDDDTPTPNEMVEMKEGKKEGKSKFRPPWGRK